MGALCHFPPPCHSSLSKLLSNSKSQGVGSRTRRRSSSFSIKASTTAFVPLEHSESTSLGDITRSDFPILRQKVNGRDLVYMDNAATSQKPNYVLKALKEYYEFSNSNVHRGVHYLSQKATTAYENAREKVADFINASDHREIVFTRNATEAINLVANSWGDLNLGSGDEILLTVAEHHSVIVPWQIVAKKKGASLKYVGLTTGEVPDIEKLKKALSNKTKLVVTHHVSNTLGSVHPIEDIVIWSHEVGARVLLDACQSVPHMMVDVQKLNVDFLVASSHKMCGPTGIGFLYGKIDLLSSMPPFLGGGEMISDVFQDYSTYADPPSRFEAGTPAIAEAVGLGAAIEYLYRIGMQRIHDYEVMDAEGVKSLALFPAKFQRSFWIKTGNFVIVDEGGREKALESGDKIACIVSQVLFHAQVRSLEKSPDWPANFKNARPVESQTFQLQPELVLNSDSDEDLPPLEANLNRRRPVDIYSDSASDSDHHS